MENLQTANIADRAAIRTPAAGMKPPAPSDVMSSNNTSQFFLGRQQPAWMNRPFSLNERRDMTSVPGSETLETHTQISQALPPRRRGRPPKRKLQDVYDNAPLPDTRGQATTTSTQRLGSDLTTGDVQETNSTSVATIDPSVRYANSTALAPDAATMSDTIVVRRREPIQLPLSPEYIT